MKPYIVLSLATLIITLMGCDSSDSDDGPALVVIGANLEITGSLPVVGESSQRAAELFTETRNEAGGVEIGDTFYPWSLVIWDNEDNVDVASQTNRSLIEEVSVLAIIGPNLSTLAIPAGAVAEDLQTPMISPWSTNPGTTEGRQWVFRAPFIDSYQGPVLARFATDEYNVTQACVFFQENEAYSAGLATSFKAAWENLHGSGSFVAEESFAEGETDFSSSLGRIQDAGCEVLLAPLFTEDVILTVMQAQELGLELPILGSDSWVSAGLLEACGTACEGFFVVAHYVPTGAVGVTRAFIDLYQDRYGSVPDDIAALTWDALLVLEQGLQNCGGLTGDLADDRSCLRAGMASIQGLKGVTGMISYGAGGDPAKCAVIGQIRDGAFTAVDTICPS